MAYPDEAWSVSAMYRQINDTNYLPMTRALAEGLTGEYAYWEQQGESFMQFPVGSILLHAGLFKLAGISGLVVADVIIPFLFLLGMGVLLMQGGFSKERAIPLAALWMVGFTPLLHLAHSGLGLNLPLEGFEPRFPRPYVTESLFMLNIAIFAVLLLRVQRFRLRHWLLAGLLCGWLVQADFYAAVTVGFSWAIYLGAQIVLKRRPLNAEIIRNVLIFGLGLILCLGFLVTQRLHVNEAVMSRFGFFDTPGGLWIFDHSKYVWVALLGLGVSALCVRNRASYLLSMLVILIASYIALPISSLLLGQAIQTYHFLDQLEFSLSLVVFIWTVTLLQPWLKKVSGSVLCMLALAALTCAVFTRQQEVRRESPINYYMKHSAVAGHAYRSDFSTLVDFLVDVESEERPLVLGSFDCQILDWWSAFKRSPIYLGGAFYTLASQDVVDARLASFCRTVQVPRVRFAQLIHEPWVLARMLGDNYFHAYSQHTQAPIEQYPEEKHFEIQEGWVHDSWNLAMPLDHADRMLAMFDSELGSENELDVIVLSQTEVAEGFKPPENYRATFENTTFIVYQKTEAGEAK